jgi:hypothetical protein
MFATEYEKLMIRPAFRRRYSTEAGAGRAASWGLEPSGQCSQPGSLNPGEALELDDRVKLTERS